MQLGSVRPGISETGDHEEPPSRLMEDLRSLAPPNWRESRKTEPSESSANWTSLIQLFPLGRRAAGTSEPTDHDFPASSLKTA